MDIGSLRILKAVADTGNFSNAAKELNYAQSHISTQILNLEQEVGAPLFLRHNRGVTLTDKGELFLKYANEMARVMEEAQRVMDASDTPNGTLRIVSMQTTAQTILPKLLSTYHRNYPDVKLTIRTGTSQSNLRTLLNYDADIAFAAGPVSDNALETTPVASEKLTILSTARTLRPDKPLQLAEFPFLVFPKGCAYRATLERYMADAGAMIHDEIEFDSIPAILAAACAGLGITLLPESVSKAYLRERSLYAAGLPKKYETLPLLAVTRKDVFHSAALKTFLSMCGGVAVS